MILRYGTYTHPDSEVTVRRRIRRKLNPNQFSTRVTRTWDVEGQLHADTATLLIAAREALQAAYYVPYRDAYLYLSDGTTVHDYLVNQGSSTGVVPQGPDYPNGDGAEGGTFLTFTLSLEASLEFTPDGPGTFSGEGGASLMEFSETISESGGGPRYALIEVIDGPPVRQKLVDRTKYVYTQQGSATGRYGFPTPPGPIAPQWLVGGPQVQRTGPIREGIVNTKYTTAWSYTFESPDALSGTPTPWEI